MKKILWVGLAGTLALVGAGFAVAAKRDKGTAAVSFALSAESDDVKTRTCDGADGAYRISHGLYRGTASGYYEGASVSVRLRTTVNTTEGLGVAHGTVAIRADDRLQAKANLRGVVAGGELTGLLSGRDVRGEDRGQLLANFSATLGDGTLTLTAGSGSAANSAVIFGGPGCEKPERERPGAASGEVTAFSASSITVTVGGTSVTCSLTEAQAAKLDGKIEVGDRVKIVCNADGELVRVGRLGKKG